MNHVKPDWLFCRALQLSMVSLHKIIYLASWSSKKTIKPISSLAYYMAGKCFQSSIYFADRVSGASLEADLGTCTLAGLDGKFCTFSFFTFMLQEATGYGATTEAAQPDVPLALIN